MKKSVKMISAVMSAVMMFSAGAVVSYADKTENAGKTEKSASDNAAEKSSAKSKSRDISKPIVSAPDDPVIPHFPDESSRKTSFEWSVYMQEHKEKSQGCINGTEKFIEKSMKTFMSENDNKNVIYSPLNVYMALGMTAEISDGNTRQQILDLLGCDDITALRAKAKLIRESNYMNDGIAVSDPAASLWLSSELSYSRKTLRSLSENYYASSFAGKMGTKKYNEVFRKWLSQHTGGLLDEQISELKIERGTAMALASTLYYEGQWDMQFYEGDTKKDTFHSPDADVECDFMNGRHDTSCIVGDDFICAELPLINNGSMRLFLPAEGNSPEELLADDDFYDIIMKGGDEFDAEGKTYTVNLSLPKFDVSSDLELIKGLKEMGVTDAFSLSESDFSPLTKDTDIVIGKVEHDTRVTIDEKGCRAAALTLVIGYGGLSPRYDELDLRFDRPFAFEIMSENGFPLFVGIVNNPNK